MSPDQLKTLLDNIISEVNNAADFADILDPGLIPFITIGKAVDKLVPGLVASVDAWIQGNMPSDAEKADFMLKLAVLSNPNAP